MNGPVVGMPVDCRFTASGERVLHAPTGSRRVHRAPIATRKVQCAPKVSGYCAPDVAASYSSDSNHLTTRSVPHSAFLFNSDRYCGSSKVSLVI